MTKRNNRCLLLLTLLFLLLFQGCQQSDAQPNITSPPGGEKGYSVDSSLPSSREKDTLESEASISNSEGESHTAEGNRDKSVSTSSKPDGNEPVKSGATPTASPQETDHSPSSSEHDSSTTVPAQTPHFSSEDTRSSRPDAQTDIEASSSDSETSGPTASLPDDTSISPTPIPGDGGNDSDESEAAPVPDEIVGPTFVVESVGAQKGSRRVPVKISIKNNPGISSIAMILSYDSSLEMESIEYNSEIGGQTILPEKLNNPLKLIWISPLADMTEDAQFVTVYFNIGETLHGGLYRLSLSYNPDDVYNLAEQNISFSIKNGGITVTE